MIIKKINSKNGITLISLIMAIIILLILSTVTVNSINASENVAPYNNMVADITLLENEVLIYYNKYGELPQLEEEKINGYYEIDLTKLDNITLNFGNRDNGDEDDIYLINKNLEVYYLKGIEKGGTIYHTL